MRHHPVESPTLALELAAMPASLAACRSLYSLQISLQLVDLLAACRASLAATSAFINSL
jgi:hypothetical protein